MVDKGQESYTSKRLPPVDDEKSIVTVDSTYRYNNAPQTDNDNLLLRLRLNNPRKEMQIFKMHCLLLNRESITHGEYGNYKRGIAAIRQAHERIHATIKRNNYTRRNRDIMIQASSYKRSITAIRNVQERIHSWRKRNKNNNHLIVIGKISCIFFFYYFCLFIHCYFVNE